MRPEIAATPPCPPPAVHQFPSDQARTDRPPTWELIREPLYNALRDRGLTEAAALAAAERGADAAIVESRLITLAESVRWGRPFTGERVEPTPTVKPLLAIENAVVDIARMGQIGDALAGHLAAVSGADREKAVAAVLWFLPRLCEEAEALETRFYRAFDEIRAAKQAAPRSTDAEGRS